MYRSSKRADSNIAWAVIVLEFPPLVWLSCGIVGRFGRGGYAKKWTMRHWPASCRANLLLKSALIIKSGKVRRKLQHSEEIFSRCPYLIDELKQTWTPTRSRLLENIKSRRSWMNEAAERSEGARSATRAQCSGNGSTLAPRRSARATISAHQNGAHEGHI